MLELLDFIFSYFRLIFFLFFFLALNGTCQIRNEQVDILTVMASVGKSTRRHHIIAHSQELLILESDFRTLYWLAKKIPYFDFLPQFYRAILHS